MSNNLKTLREARGMTQEKLSAQSGVNRVQIARYETTDRGMTIETAAKLADALRCTIDEIYERKEA